MQPSDDEMAGRRQRAAREHDERWQGTVTLHGDVVWRAAAFMDRSPQVASIIRDFLSSGAITTPQARLLWAITRDLERSDARARKAA